MRKLILFVACFSSVSHAVQTWGGGDDYVSPSADLQRKAGILRHELSRLRPDAIRTLGISSGDYDWIAAYVSIRCAEGKQIDKLRERGMRFRFFRGSKAILIDCANYVVESKLRNEVRVAIFHEMMRAGNLETANEFSISQRLPTALKDESCAGKLSAPGNREPSYDLNSKARKYRFGSGGTYI